MNQVKYFGSCLSLRLQPLLTKELFGCQFRRPILLDPNRSQNRRPIGPPAGFLGFEVSLAAHLLSFDALGLHHFCHFETGRPNSGMRSDSLSCSRSMSAGSVGPNAARVTRNICWLQVCRSNMNCKSKVSAQVHLDVRFRNAIRLSSDSGGRQSDLTRLFWESTQVDSNLIS